jgi:hypothetical protein
VAAATDIIVQSLRMETPPQCYCAACYIVEAEESFTCSHEAIAEICSLRERGMAA